MTLPATPFRKDHTLTGAIVPLLYDWKIENKKHLLVTLVNTSVTPNVETTLAVDTDYAVSGVGSDAGGNVTPTTAYTAGWKIAITSNVPYEQDTDFTNQNSVLQEGAESMADKIGRQVKQIVEVLSRCVKTTVGGGVQPDDLLDAINDAVTLSGTNVGLTGADVVTTGNNAAAAQAAQAAAESAAAGMKWRPSARAATTANITLSGAQTIDGVSVIAGDRVLVKNQSTASQNGVYVAAAGAWSRATDADTWLELISQTLNIDEGTTQADYTYICTVNAGGTLGSTAVTFSPLKIAITQQPSASIATADSILFSDLDDSGKMKQDTVANLLALSSALGRIVNVQGFTVGGTYTRSAGVTKAIVILAGATGGGSANATNNGTAGGTTSFGSLMSCTGGAGGTLKTVDDTFIPPAAGTPTGGTVMGWRPGGAGASGYDGGGQWRFGQLGGGAPVTIGYVTPSTSETVTIGAAGTGGAAGMEAGANGFAGTIIVIELS